VIIATM